MSDEFIQKRHEAFSAPEVLVFELVKKSTGANPVNRKKIIQGNDNEVYRIATEQGKPAGFLIGYEREDKSFFLWMIGVLPSFRKKGILKEFYTRAADWAKRMGYSKITITTGNNRREMLSFLVKNDFEFTSIDAREKIEDYRIHAPKRL